MTFTLAMVKNPRVWKRAQAEIDAVLGIHRLPEFQDRQSLPYVEAIMRETFRWKPVGPLGACLGPSFAEVHILTYRRCPTCHNKQRHLQWFLYTKRHAST